MLFFDITIISAFRASLARRLRANARVSWVRLHSLTHLLCVMPLQHAGLPRADATCPDDSLATVAVLLVHLFAQRG